MCSNLLSVMKSRLHCMNKTFAESGGTRRKVLIVVLTLVTTLVLLSLGLFLYSQRRKKIDIWVRKEGEQDDLVSQTE